MAGAGAKAGLVPLHAWLPLAHPAAPSHVSALMSAAMTKVALYVAARLLAWTLLGPAQPLWWGMPLIALGAASAALGALRANLEDEGKTLLACSTIENVGLIAIGLGLAGVCFRAADLGCAGRAGGGRRAAACAEPRGVQDAALPPGMGEVAVRCGDRARLDLLGGSDPRHALSPPGLRAGRRRAPRPALPPLSGFAGEWLLLQALLAAWRVGDLAFQLLVAGRHRRRRPVRRTGRGGDGALLRHDLPRPPAQPARRRA